MYARRRARGAPSPAPSWRTGLILGAGHIGDVLYRTCSLDLLVKGLPDCRWSYLTTSAGAATLKGNPALPDILAWQDDDNGVSHDGLAALRDHAYDVALCTDYVAHQKMLLLAVKLGIPNRVAFVRKGLSGLATIGMQVSRGATHPQAMREMFELITDVPDSTALRPKIFPAPADAHAADAEWTRLGLKSGDGVIACAVTRNQSAGQHPPDVFIEIVRRILAIAPELRVVFTGVSGDREVLAAAGRAIDPRVLVSAGNLSILAFGSFLANCAAFLGTDSGARHLANAAAIPVFFIRNMAVAAAETGVYCATERDIAPAGEYLSPAAIVVALKKIDVERVANSLVAAARSQAPGTHSNKTR